jgi:hypothetical protein
MTDIFREVDEDLRRERAEALWKKYGNYIIAVAAVVVVATAGIVQYRNWQGQRAAATGERFVAALQLLDDGKRADAEAAFKDIVSSGTGSYPSLAAFGAAGAKAANSDVQGAVADFDAIAADSKTPAMLRDLAKVRAAILLADTAPLADLEKRLLPLAADTGTFRHTAREVLGLAAWRTKDFDAARKYLGQIVADRTAPQGLQQRATVILGLIQSEAGDEAAADTTTPAPAVPPAAKN